MSRRAAPAALAPGGRPSSSKAKRCKGAAAPSTGAGSGRAQSAGGLRRTAWPPRLAPRDRPARAACRRRPRGAPRGPTARLVTDRGGRGTRASAAAIAASCAALASSASVKLGLGRHAELLADGVVELEPERHWLACVLRGDVQRQNDLARVADGCSAGAVVEPHRRRIEHGHRLDVVGGGEVEHRRHAGVARIAPVGFPSRRISISTPARNAPSFARAGAATSRADERASLSQGDASAVTALTEGAAIKAAAANSGKICGQCIATAWH